MSPAHPLPSFFTLEKPIIVYLYITDPRNGKTYRCIIKILDNGAKLEVRGYIGFSLIGRSQYWYRIK
jgi:hypothetical protein